MRTFNLSKAIVGANSPKDYAVMASENIENLNSYSAKHDPYTCGNRNIFAEYTNLLKQKGVMV